MIDPTAVRQRLRVLRKQKFRSGRDAAVAAKISHSTIAKIENLKRWPTYDPPLGIVVKLLAAIGQSFTTFVSDLERQTEPGLHPNVRHPTIEPPQQEQQVAYADRSVSLAHDLGALFLKAAARSNRAITRSTLIDLAYAVEHSDGPLPTGQRSSEVGDPESGRGRGRRRAG